MFHIFHKWSKWIEIGDYDSLGIIISIQKYRYCLLCDAIEYKPLIINPENKIF